MAIRIGSLLSRPALLATLIGRARLAVRLLREPRVPLLTKVVLALAMLYVVSPVDFLPDIFPLLGQLDDLAIVLMALELFPMLCPAAARAFHEQAITRRQAYTPMPSTDDFIEAEWQRDPA